MQALAVQRSKRFIAWEDAFAFGGGSPPWMSGMAQATGIQALAREMGLGRLDFVKVDVEGFEEGVLDGMSVINDTLKPIIFMEFNAFTLAVHARTSPYAVLERIRDRFGGFVAVRDERPYFVRSDDELGQFFFENMTRNGCVEDIVFSASPDLRSAFAL